MELRNCPKCGELMKSGFLRFCGECGYPYWNPKEPDDSSPSLEETVTPLRYISRLEMGHYQGQPVFWRPLLEERDNVLAITENIIDCQPYSEYSTTDGGFEESSLRTWLNEVLLFDMLNTRERELVDGEIFCLNANQAVSLFTNDRDRIAYPTAYALLRAQGKDYRNATCWWLADPGNPDCAQFVRRDGQVYPFGANAEYDYGVRPALWIKRCSIK